MKAIITKGKYKGECYEVSQWCNDWFTLNSNNIKIATKPFSPSSLLFNLSAIHEIKQHKNNGMLFGWYEVRPTKTMFDKEGNAYSWTFKKLK